MDNRSMNKRQLICFASAFILTISVGQLSAQNIAQQTTTRTAAPTFAARSLLDQRLLQQTNFQIDESVPVRNHRYQFTVRTPYGAFPAAGIYMLDKRLREIHAIETAAKLADGPVIINQAVKTLRDTPNGALTVFSDPVGSLQRLPRGFERMASGVLNAQDRRAGGTKFRHLALSLGVDPETRNPVLRHVLNNVAMRQSIGSTASKFALSAALPGLGLVSTMEEFKTTVAEKSPHEISAQVNSQLAAANVWKPVRDEFANSPRYTSMEKLLFMRYFRQVSNVEGIGLMVHKANQDASEADVLTRLAEMRLLSELHQTAKIQSVIDYGLPIATVADNRVIGVCSVDYLVNTPAVTKAAVAFRRANPDRSLLLLTTGQPSPQVAKVFEESQIGFQRAEYANANAPVPYTAGRQTKSGFTQ